jgi:F plasmid transfer operon, TraF, protein
MNNNKLLLGAIVVTAMGSAEAAPFSFLDARSVAMGNVSVATGNIAIAGLSNPAMLILNENDDAFALLLPALGAQAIDNDGVSDLIDEFQVLDEQFSANPTPETANAMIALLNDLEGDVFLLNADANAALAYAGENWAFAGTFRGHIRALAVTENVDTNFDINTLTGPNADFSGVGVLTRELGFSVATKFNILGMDLAVGVTPKTVSVDSIDITYKVDSVNEEDIIDERQSLGSYSSLDAGVALQVTDSITLGLAAKDLLSESMTTANGTTFNFDTQVRAGVAYHNDWFTVAADMDLTEQEPLFTESPSQMLAAGMEFNVLDYLQLRAGYQTNIASGSDDPAMYSAGIGLWLGFHLDVAVMLGENDSSAGAMVQTGFRF